MSFKLDKEQRDEMLGWIGAEIEVYEGCIECEEQPRNTDIQSLRILKSLKAMVESFDTTGKQVEDSGDVRHEQKTVTIAYLHEFVDELEESYKGGQKGWLYHRLKRELEDHLGIKVTDKEG